MLLSASIILALIANPACGNVPADSELARHLNATVAIESAGDPFAIGVNADVVRGLPAYRVTATSADEATAKAVGLLAQGRHIDLGLFQISDRQLAHHHLTVRMAFDECANTAAGAQHLADDYRAVWDLAHRRYNCGGVECGADYAMRVTARLGAGIPASPDKSTPLPPPCAPAWDAWALASCTQAASQKAGGASSVAVSNPGKPS